MRLSYVQVDLSFQHASSYTCHKVVNARRKLVYILYDPRNNASHFCLSLNNSLRFNYVYQKHGVGRCSWFNRQWVAASCGLLNCGHHMPGCSGTRFDVFFLVIILCPPSPAAFSIFVWGKKIYKHGKFLSMSMISSI